MGCTSSTHVVTNPHTGQTNKVHKNGGSYPGNRRTPQQVYTPAASEFNSQGQATAHFISYGGGNALVLQQGGIPQPQIGIAQEKPQFIQVTLPAGVSSGQKIHVQAPDGRLNEIIVPDGFGPGSAFTVEFADTTTKPAAAPEMPPPYVSSYPSSNDTVPISTAVPATNNTQDDGFASGFNNPDFVATAPAAGTDANMDLSAYPSASDAKPVYSTTPQYSANPY